MRSMYQNNADVIAGTFPTLFPNDSKRPRKAKRTPNPKVVEKLMKFEDGRFARNTKFKFLVFNQKMRNDAASNVCWKINGSDAAAEKFTKLVNDPTFETRLDEAIADPEGKTARALLKPLLKIVKLCGGKVPWSPYERSQSKSHLIAMSHFFGLPSIFATISPNMSDQPLALKIALGSNNLDEVQIPLHLSKKRTQLLNDNPVAAAQVFNHLIKHFFKTVCNLKKNQTCAYGFEKVQPNMWKN